MPSAQSYTRKTKCRGHLDCFGSIRMIDGSQHASCTTKMESFDTLLQLYVLYLLPKVAELGTRCGRIIRLAISCGEAPE